MNVRAVGKTGQYVFLGLMGKSWPAAPTVCHLFVYASNLSCFWNQVIHNTPNTRDKRAHLNIWTFCWPDTPPWQLWKWLWILRNLTSEVTLHWKQETQKFESLRFLVLHVVWVTNYLPRKCFTLGTWRFFLNLKIFF